MVTTNLVPAVGFVQAMLLALAASCATAAELPVYAVTITNGRIEPARLEVPAATKFKLTIKNAGSSPCEFEGREVRIEKVLSAGAESFVVIPPLKPGTYRFFDEFHPDAADMLLVAN